MLFAQLLKEIQFFEFKKKVELSVKMSLLVDDWRMDLTYNKTFLHKGKLLFNALVNSL